MALRAMCKYSTLLTPWVFVCELFHICGSPRSESGVEVQLEGGAEFGNESRVGALTCQAEWSRVLA